MIAQDARERRYEAIFFLLLVLLLSCVTYVWGFNRYPVLLDEHYYITDAQRAIHGIFFMKHNPPLGKLLDAAGEMLLHGQTNNDQYVNVSVITTMIPASFDPTGYRLFPVILAALIAPVFFLIFYKKSGNPLLSALLTTPVLFDNALIVHLRSAMLEGPLIFFSALSILAFLLLIESAPAGRRLLWMSVFFGAAWGLACTVKFEALVLFLLVPFAVWHVRGSRRSIGMVLLATAAAFLIVNVAVWQIHFATATQIDPHLENRGLFNASPAYQSILAHHLEWSPMSFPIMLRDSILYAIHYNEAIPPLEPATSGMGSHFYLWPFGSKDIPYIPPYATPGSHSYIFLQINPAAWAAGLFGVLLCVFMLIRSWVQNGWRKMLDDHIALLALLAVYLGYMAAMSRIRRVMFLYHYFTPLLVSFVLFGLTVIILWKQSGENNRNKILWGLLGCCVIVFCCYEFFLPLTDGIPITHAQLLQREWIPLWGLR